MTGKPSCPECGSNSTYNQKKAKQQRCYACGYEWKPDEVSKKKEPEAEPVEDEVVESILEEAEKEKKKKFKLPDGFPEPEEDQDYIIEPE